MFFCNNDCSLFVTRWLALVKGYWQRVESTMENADPSRNALKSSKRQQRARVGKPSYKVRLGMNFFTREKGSAEVASIPRVLVTFEGILYTQSKLFLIVTVKGSTSYFHLQRK